MSRGMMLLEERVVSRKLSRESKHFCLRTHFLQSCLNSDEFVTLQCALIVEITCFYSPALIDFFRRLLLFVSVLLQVFYKEL